MKNAMKIYIWGQNLMVLGSLLYIVELLTIESAALTTAIALIYVVSLVLILIGWFGTKEERKAEKARKKQGQAGPASSC